MFASDAPQILIASPKGEADKSYINVNRKFHLGTICFVLYFPGFFSSLPKGWNRGGEWKINIFGNIFIVLESMLDFLVKIWYF